jgi:Na+/proline symporter
LARIDYIVILFYFILVLGLGFWYARRAGENLESYFLGGKRMHWLTLAMSGAVSNFDITGTMWMVSVLYLLGMKSWWHHWMWGVMLPAFGLAYMAGWVRKSGVITGAEWMSTRFGDGPGGRAARICYAIMAVVTCASFIGYAFQGIGKFATVYVPLERMAPYLGFASGLVTAHKPETLAVLVLSITTVYVVAGGLRSVVITDVIQTVILTMAAVLISVVAFNQVTPEIVSKSVPDGWASLIPAWRIPEFHGTDNAMYEMFGFLTVAWIIKGLFLNAGGPGQMYDFQRYLAARNARDAAKLAAAWPFFLVVRWAMVAGITLLALAGIANVTDPEMVMPMVLHKYLPVGLRGLVIAGLLAAFMSTFSSTANSGASYIVRDVWQPLFSPEADERSQVRWSYIATIGIVIAGIIIGFNAESIASIWGWIMMALGGAVIVPNVLRWHWWRMNGWGYAAGVIGGILLSLVPLFVSDMPVYKSFPLICCGTLVASIAVSLLTPPTGRETLKEFYRTVKPFGAWTSVKTDIAASGPEVVEASGPTLRPVLNTLIAVIGITGLYLFPMYLIGHWHMKSILCVGAFMAAAVSLYFTWYQHLPRPEGE